MSAFRFSEVKTAAEHKWAGVLIAAGLAPEILNGRHHPCPGCGGTDRFRYIDTKGDGFFICNGGGDRVAGDGFQLLQHACGMAASEALRYVADHLGLAGRELTKADRSRYQQRRILEALQHELEVLRIAVADRLSDRALSEPDTKRERLAMDRIQRGMEALRDRF